MFESGKKIPATAMAFNCELQFGDNGEDAKSSPIKMLARTFALSHPFWGKVEHDFAGMEHRSKIPLDYCHDAKELVGYANKFEVNSDGLILSGALTPYKDDRASEIVHKARQGVPYQASIDFRGPVSIEEVGEGLTVEVNGHEFAGPGLIIRKWMLRGCAVCPHGMDGNTTSNVFSDDSKEYEAEILLTDHELEVQETAMSKEQLAEGNVPVEANVGESVEEVIASVEAETLAAETLTQTVAVVEAIPVVTPATIAKQFLDAYGDKGLRWMAEGKSFEEARDLFIADLKAENADLKGRVTVTKQQMGEPAPLSTSTVPVETVTETKKEIPAGLYGVERAIFTQLRMPE